MFSFRLPPSLLLLVLWLVLTAINIDKAFHIDDTFHLEAAAHIKVNPLKPMSGLINWHNNPSPMYGYNQPPLFFGLLALFTSLFGVKELPLHLLLSVFTFAGLFFFYKIARLLVLPNTNTLLVLFALCPAFVVNQNVMTDVPVLAIILASSYYLLRAKSEKKLLNYCLSAVFLTMGLLIKYSVLPLIVVLVLVLLVRRDFKYLLMLLIPLKALVLWSFWNYIEYGSFHIVDRENGGFHVTKVIAFIACLGSISTFSVSLVHGLFRNEIICKLIYSVLLLFSISVGLFIFDVIPEKKYANYLNLVFKLNGLVIVFAILLQIVREVKNSSLHVFFGSDRFVLLLYGSSLSAFIILFAPFMATRHVLLIIPFLLLFSHNIISRSSSIINRLVLFSTIILGLGLGISDWMYADYYRRRAAMVELPADRNVWAAGLWGWKWYAEQNGMRRFDTDESPVQEGDFLVRPGDVPKQAINKKMKLVLIEKRWEDANALTFFSGKKFASLYNSFEDKPPWTLSKAPVDTIYIYRIEFFRDSL